MNDVCSDCHKSLLLYNDYKKEDLPAWEVLLRLPSLDWASFVAPVHSPCAVLVAGPLISPTRLSNLTSLVRPISKRLIRTTSATTRRRSTIESTNKETDVMTPVNRIAQMVAHIHIAGIEKDAHIQRCR
jgi:hypothetical protein